MQDDVQSRDRQVRVGSTSGSDCVNTEAIIGSFSATVVFECSDSGQVIMPPCVQYFVGRCSSMVFTGMNKEDICNLNIQRCLDYLIKGVRYSYRS